MDAETDGLDRRLRELMSTRVAQLIEGGLGREDAAASAVRELLDDFAKHGETVADGLAEVTRAHLVQRNEYDTGFQNRLNESYGEAFEAYDTVVEVVAQAARDFWHRYQETGERDELVEVLWGNLAQALRVIREVGHLPRGGFPYGALASQRTAHELAVRSIVLRSHGREPGHEDLAERYRLHDFIGQEAEVREYQLNAEALGHTPFPDSEARAAAERRHILLHRFGKQFGTPYGWAVGLPGVAAGNFRELEALAGIDHRRGFYRWASHFVHGDPSSLRMSVVRRGGISQGVLSDRTNVHLTDPAQFALYALQLIYVSVTMDDAPALADFYITAGLSHLIGQAAHAFQAAEQQVKVAEEALQAHLAAESGDS